jgi:SAM-dependent methyltransferase
MPPAATGSDPFDGALSSAEERRRFLDLLALSPVARPFEAIHGWTGCPDESLDAVLCIDAIAEVPDRAAVLADWVRSLKPGGRVLYTDPTIVAGLVTSDELALRGSMGLCVFSPPGENEYLIESSGLRLLRADDAAETFVTAAARLLDDRAGREADLVGTEGRERYDAKQRVLSIIHRLAAERRLARIAFVVEKAR